MRSRKTLIILLLSIALIALVGKQWFQPAEKAEPKSVAGMRIAEVRGERGFKLGELTFAPCELGQRDSAATTAAFCAPFRVPENWDRPDGRQIDLKLAIVRSDAEVAFSPGFRWGVTIVPGQVITLEDVYAHTGITYPNTLTRELTGAEIHRIMEDVADNLFHPDPYYRQGGDMVRLGGLSYVIEPADQRDQGWRLPAGARAALQDGELGESGARGAGAARLRRRRRASAGARAGAHRFSTSRARGAVVLSMGACQITMRRQSIKPEELVEGLTPIPSGVVRVMELQEKGYAYIRP